MNGSNDAAKTEQLTLDQYQQKALETAVFPPHMAESYLPMKLCEEAGEVAGKIAKRMRGDASLQDPEAFRQLIGKELGDVLWYVAALADHFNFTLSEIAGDNVAKLADRAARGVLKGSGDNR